jgi:hypothetical protein
MKIVKIQSNEDLFRKAKIPEIQLTVALRWRLKWWYSRVMTPSRMVGGVLEFRKNLQALHSKENSAFVTT